jgi:hypothetical protein
LSEPSEAFLSADDWVSSVWGTYQYKEHMVQKTSFNMEFQNQVHSLYLAGINIHVPGPLDIYLTYTH